MISLPIFVFEPLENIEMNILIISVRAISFCTRKFRKLATVAYDIFSVAALFRNF